MTPGQHTIEPFSPERAAFGNLHDTILIMLPGPKLLAACLHKWPSQETTSQTALLHKQGALHINKCRVPYASPEDQQAACPAHATGMWGIANHGKPRNEFLWEVCSAGRWPPNILLIHGTKCKPQGTKVVSSNMHFPAHRGPSGIFDRTGGLHGQPNLPESSQHTEVVPACNCQPDCPIRLLDEMCGATSRFFPQFTSLDDAKAWLQKLTAQL